MCFLWAAAFINHPQKKKHHSSTAGVEEQRPPLSCERLRAKGAGEKEEKKKNNTKGRARFQSAQSASVNFSACGAFKPNARPSVIVCSTLFSHEDWIAGDVRRLTSYLPHALRGLSFLWIDLKKETQTHGAVGSHRATRARFFLLFHVGETPTPFISPLLMSCREARVLFDVLLAAKTRRRLDSSGWGGI